MSGACACGHSEEEHGGEDEFPGATMCLFNPDHESYDHQSTDPDCPCEAYERAALPGDAVANNKGDQHGK